MARKEKSKNGLLAIAEQKLKAGKSAEARRMVEGHLKRHKKDAEGHRLLGEVLLARGDLKPALDAFQEAHRLEPGRGDILSGIGLTLARGGALAEARRALAVAVDQRVHAKAFLQ